jgi:hypothetical protein
MRRAAPKAGTSVEDCALENFVDHCAPKELAQLRPAAAGLERSAAHPANEVGPSKNAAALRGVPTQVEGLHLCHFHTQIHRLARRRNREHCRHHFSIFNLDCGSDRHPNGPRLAKPGLVERSEIERDPR